MIRIVNYKIVLISNFESDYYHNSKLYYFTLMKRLIENYFLQIVKPTLTIATFVVDYNCLYSSHFINRFYSKIYLLLFLIKPVFYTTLLIGLMIRTTVTAHNLCGAIAIISCFFLGLPIREYNELFDLVILKSYFEGREYIMTDYIRTHYVINAFLENIPIALFVFTNCLMLKKESDMVMDPLVVNILCMIVGGLFVLNHSNRRIA